MKFDTKSKQLPMLFIGSSVAYLKADLKSWSIGTIHARSHNGHSYQILTETGLIISRNHVHLRPTRVQPVDKPAKPCIPNVKANKPIVIPGGNPTPSNAVKASKPCSTKNTAKINDVPLEPGQVERFISLHVIETNYVCMHVIIIVLN